MIGVYLFKLNHNNLQETLKIKNLDFVWVASSNYKYLEVLKSSGLKLFYPFGVVGAKTPVEKKYTAINKNEDKIPTYAGWYTGVCPNNSYIRNKRLNDLKKFMKSKVAKLYDGVYLDAIRYPTYWEDKNVEYLDTCYCKTCKMLFKNQKNNWQNFRIKQIESFVKEIKKIIMNKKLGYFAVPESSLNLTKIFAQPPKVFAKYFDFVSPMVYPQMVGKDLKWVSRTYKFFTKYFNKNQIILIIQTSKMPEVSPDKWNNNDAKDLAQHSKKLGHFGYFALDLITTHGGNTDKANIINSF